MHYITIKSKTLICHFNQNTPARSFVNPSIFAGYEMTKMSTKLPKRVRHDLGTNWPPYSHFVCFGTKWPNWVRNGCYWVRNDQKRYEMTWVRNDLGTKWLATPPTTKSVIIRHPVQYRHTTIIYVVRVPYRSRLQWRHVMKGKTHLKWIYISYLFYLILYCTHGTSGMLSLLMDVTKVSKDTCSYI